MQSRTLARRYLTSKQCAALGKKARAMQAKAATSGEVITLDTRASCTYRCDCAECALDFQFSMERSGALA